MPARVSDLERAARKLGFIKVRQRGSHARWKHPDGRSETIPMHSSMQVGGWLFFEILSQLGITEEEYRELLQHL